MKLLLLEDHEELQGAISRRMRSVGHSVDIAGTIKQAELFLATEAYAVLVVDRIVPDGDTIELVRRFRRAGNQTPVLLLTAMDEIEHRVEGLEAGADDYLVKPFAMDELLARVTALSRRTHQPGKSFVEIANIRIDLGRREVSRDGTLIPLRPKEFAVLELLAANLAQVVSKHQILDSCWDVLSDTSSNVEEAIIASLRRKLGKPSVVFTVRGAGYMLDEPKDE